MTPFLPVQQRLVRQVQIFHHIVITHLGEVDVVTTHCPERVRRGEDDQFIHLRPGFSDRLNRADRDSSNQAAWVEVPDGLDGYEERRTGRDSVIHENDNAVGECGEVPILAIELLP